MLRMRFKLMLCFSLMLIPISTQTGSDLILSDNWAIQREIEWLKIRLEQVEEEIAQEIKKNNLELALVKIRRDSYDKSMLHGK